MNLNKKQIREKIKEIKENAQKIGMEVDLEEEDIYEYKQDALWYGNTVGTITYGNYDIFVNVYGDVCADYYENGEYKEHINDKNNARVLIDLLDSYIKDDEELEKVVKYEFINQETINENEKVLFVNSNNWIEISIFDNKANQWITDGLEAIYEEDNDVLSPFENLNYYIDYIKEIEKEAVLV